LPTVWRNLSLEKYSAVMIYMWVTFPEHRHEKDLQKLRPIVLCEHTER